MSSLGLNGRVAGALLPPLTNALTLLVSEYAEIYFHIPSWSGSIPTSRRSGATRSPPGR